MRADQRGVEHQVFIVAILDQRGKDLLPDPGLGPAAETLVKALVLAVALGQVAPVGARAQNPQDTVHEQAVVRPRAAGIAGLTR